jgi:hypothetical protein
VLRRSALSRLTVADQIDGELLRLVADTSAALAALEAETMQAIAPIPGTGRWSATIIRNSDCGLFGRPASRMRGPVAARGRAAGAKTTCCSGAEIGARGQVMWQAGPKGDGVAFE